MKETPLFRNIQHVPRIWGVTYVKLFASLGIGLLVITVSFAVATHGSAIQKICLIGLSVGVTVVIYIVSFWLDNRDPLESGLTFLRNEFNSQTLSLQRVAILDRNEIPRSS